MKKLGEVLQDGCFRCGEPVVDDLPQCYLVCVTFSFTEPDAHIQLAHPAIICPKCAETIRLDEEAADFDVLYDTDLRKLRTRKGAPKRAVPQTKKKPSKPPARFSKKCGESRCAGCKDNAATCACKCHKGKPPFSAHNPDPNWPNNPCPICGRRQSCDHTVEERGGV